MGEVQLHDTGVESIRSFAKVPSSQRYLSGTTTGSYSTLMMMMMVMVMMMMIIMVMMMMMMNMMTMAILITFIFMST